MKPLWFALNSALAFVDRLFDALSALMRVLLRGTFAPDARDYRGSRYAALSERDVLLQEVELNAGDAQEARKAIALDPEHVLPLATDVALYDVAGPVDASAPRSRPERSYLVGLTRAETLARLREELPLGRRGAVEGFVFFPPAPARTALAFVDETGAKRRRRRRAMVLMSAVAVFFAAEDTVRTADESMQAAVASSESERAQADRRIRVLERRATAAEAALAASNTGAALPLREALAAVDQVAVHQPGETETQRLAVGGGVLTWSGRAYSADSTELALRRAFEGDALIFSAQTGEAPAPFEARLNLRPTEAQR
jgi:hypothetical protein